MIYEKEKTRIDRAKAKVNIEAEVIKTRSTQLNAFEDIGWETWIRILWRPLC